MSLPMCTHTHSLSLSMHNIETNHLICLTQQVWSNRFVTITILGTNNWYRCVVNGYIPVHIVLYILLQHVQVRSVKKWWTDGTQFLAGYFDIPLPILVRHMVFLFGFCPVTGCYICLSLRNSMYVHIRLLRIYKESI